MSETKLDIILKKVNDIEKLIWDDRKFYIRLANKMDTILQFIDNFTAIEDIPLDDIMSKDEQKVMKQLTDKLSDIKQFEKEMDKYRKYLNPDQIGES